MTAAPIILPARRLDPRTSSVERIFILYPGATSSERVNNPQNFSLSRLLMLLHERGEPPIYLLNHSAWHEQYGNIEFIHFTTRNFIRLLGRFAFQRNALIVSQTGRYLRHAALMRAAMPGSRVLVRLGGVYFGREHLESPAFERERRRLRRGLAKADMILSTADGTPVDLYMAKVGVSQHRYRKWLNGFPVIENRERRERTNRILCVARLSPEKAIDYVIRSFAMALPKLAEPHVLVIVGDGPEKENLRLQAASLGIEREVEFAGQHDDVGPFLYSSKLLVSGLANNTVIEAIATGTPVVTVELGETAELYGGWPNVHVVDYPRGGCGRIPTNQLAGLVSRTADVIVAVLNHYSHLERADPSIARVAHGWDERLKDELALYETLLSAPKA